MVILSDDIPNRSGVGAYYQDLVEHLRDHISKVELFCPARSDGSPYQVFSIPLPADPTRKLYFPNSLPISRAIRHIEPHIIAVATPGPFGVLGYLLAKQKRIPLCYGYHVQYNKLVELYWKRVFGKVSSAFMSAIDKRFFRASAAVVAVSIPMLESAREAGAQNAWLMGTPIAKNFFETPAPALSSTIASVLYAGRLTKEKNVETILEVAQRLPHLNFIIAGDGPLKKVFQEYSENFHNLEYLGWLPREKLIPVIDNSDLLILPSHNDAFGTIALEAMARKKFVLVSEACGITRWPALAKGIFLIENGESPVEAIQRITQLNPREREAKADIARHNSLSFNDQTISRWLNVFDKLVHHPGWD